MDKRTLIFIFVFLVAFFGLNLYFSYDRDKKSREELKHKEALTAQKSAIRQEDLAKKTAPLTSLPLIEIYEDAAGEKLLRYGIEVKGATLTLAWKEELPSSIFVKPSMKKQQLITEHPVSQGPVVYASPDFANLEIASVPQMGRYDVQLVVFPPGQPRPKVYYAEYENGTLNFPSETPEANGIALLKSDSKYLPLGFYEAKGQVFVEMQNLPLLSQIVRPSPSQASKSTAGEQKYYVLENDYLQLVFTNVGGALSEVNLPFETEKNPLSVVKEIEFDREIAKENPLNAHFPLHPFLSPDSQKTAQQGAVGGYYPLMRRDLLASSGAKEIKISPQYYALNIVSDYPEMAEQVYEVKEFSANKIVFEAAQPHRRISKTFTLEEGAEGAPYIVTLDLKIEGDSRGLWLTSGIPEAEILSGSSNPQIQYRISRTGKKANVEKLDLPKQRELVSMSSIHPDWVVNSNGYLGMIMDPLSEIGAGFKATGISGTTVPTRLTLVDPQYQRYKAADYPGYQVLLPIPTSGGELSFRVFAGPFEEGTLKTVDRYYSDPTTGYNPDYLACKTFYGWFSFISEPFAKILFVVMKFFYTLTGSWGFSIILLTVFLRIILYPLNAWSIKSMKRMQQISPQIQAIQAKHKKDPKKAQVEIMQLYREKKVNPFTGCVPILIQIPFLIGMFDLLKSSFQLRGASFIPGWIDDLTAPDVLFQWKQPIFFIGNQFHLLPILLGVVMFFQQKFSSPLPKNRAEWTDQQRQQKVMGNIMTLVFAVMFYKFPSGLNIYWLSSMLLGILQQWLTNKWIDRQKTTPEKTIAAKKAKS